MSDGVETLQIFCDNTSCILVFASVGVLHYFDSVASPNFTVFIKHYSYWFSYCTIFPTRKFDSSVALCLRLNVIIFRFLHWVEIWWGTFLWKLMGGIRLQWWWWLLVPSGPFIKRFMCINFSILYGNDDLVYSIDLVFMLTYQNIFRLIEW